MNGLNFFLLQMKDCMMEASWWEEGGPISLGDPITTTWMPNHLVTKTPHRN